AGRGEADLPRPGLAARRIDRGARLVEHECLAVAVQRLLEAVGADLVADARHALGRALQPAALARPFAAGVERRLEQRLSGSVQEAGPGTGDLEPRGEHGVLRPRLELARAPSLGRL